ncbi:MAG: hypothetical protein NUV91_01490 [Candidatus Omnitrophica bacterium]|nr:hypothetical protein [Candidatus Omnitrophota bacterium]
MRMNMFVALTITIIGFAIYSNVLSGEFLSDDYKVIVENPAIRDLSNIREIWETFNTRFLVGLTFAINYHFGKLDVVGYHIFNVILHLINTFFVYQFLLLTYQAPALKNNPPRSRAPELAFYSALIFLCHPIQTQAVSFVTQRFVEMGTLFYILSLLFYAKARLTKKRRYYIATGVMMILGFLSKEMTVTIVAMLWVYEFFFVGSSCGEFWKKIKAWLPFVVVTGVFPLVFLQNQPDSVWGLKEQVSTNSFDLRYFLTEINVLRTYLRLFILPISQIHEYDYPLVQEVWEFRTILSILVLFVLVIVAFRQFHKQRLISFAIVWFFITTSVEITVASIVDRSLIYEHWLYLPMVGFAILLPVVLCAFFEDSRSVKRLMIAIIFVLSLLTYQRNFVWQAEIGFWQDNIKKTPNIPQAHWGMGEAYQRKRLYRQAYDSYQKAISFLKGEDELTPLGERFYSALYSNLATVSFKLCRDDEMFQYFEKSLELDPQNTKTLNNLNQILHFYEQHQDASQVKRIREILDANSGFLKYDKAL